MAEQSFNEVVEKYTSTVYGVAMTRLRSRADADDVFQEVFLAYFREKPRFADEEHRKAWLITAAVRYSGKLLRKAARTVPLSSVPEQADCFTFRTEDETAVYSALCSLPEKYRTVLHLFYFEQLTAEEIAAATRARAGTVRMQLTRGRELMREKLKGDFE